jgi:V/A-type H+-transporting ATPase subunit E
MSTQVQELIDKIKQEGVQTAQKEAETITKQAREEAGRINEEAKSSGEQYVISAKNEIKKIEDSTQMALRQAARDMILSLRRDILRMLQTIVTEDVRDALTTEQLATIITEAVKGSSGGEAQVTVGQDDLKKLEEHFIAKIQNKVKGGVTFAGSQDIDKGFTVSYDGGKSSFDFTDVSLAQYLSQFVNERVGKLLSESVK